VESENPETLKEMNKKANLKIGPENYEEAFSIIHRHRISILGAFIYGFDTDTSEALDKRTKYIINSGVDAAEITILTLLPETRLFKRIKEGGRLIFPNFPGNWKRYDTGAIVMKPKLMDRFELGYEMDKAFHRIWSRKNIMRKYFKTLHTTKSPMAAGFAFVTNMVYRTAGLKAKKDYKERLGGIMEEVERRRLKEKSD
jgi:predicted RNA-binding protein